MESAYRKPPRTMMEVFRSLPEGTLVQLINNQLYLYPSHTDAHQSILGKILLQFGNFVEENNAGKFLLGPFDVYLNKRNAFQPDIIFALNENLNKFKAGLSHFMASGLLNILLIVCFGLKRGY